MLVLASIMKKHLSLVYVCGWESIRTPWHIGGGLREPQEFVLSFHHWFWVMKLGLSDFSGKCFYLPSHLTDQGYSF